MFISAIKRIDIKSLKARVEFVGVSGGSVWRRYDIRER